MRLYLVRHGKAKSADDDPRRGLTADGIADIERIAELCERSGVRVGSVYHSEKFRAEETARILAETIGPGIELRATSNLLPDADPRSIVPLLNAVEQDLLAVGHLPHVGLLTSLLLRGRSDHYTVRFTAGTMACLERTADAWTLLWVLPPEMLR